MIGKEERSPFTMPFLFYWRISLKGVNNKDSKYFCIRGVVNYFARSSFYDGIGTPYSSPYTSLIRLGRSARFFDISNLETLFQPIYHSEYSLKIVTEHKEEILGDLIEIKRKIEEKYKILYGDIPYPNGRFSLWTERTNKNLVEDLDKESGK